uniref:Misato Segment II tubulin-like domain-containing protein n=1 Tax=Anopheles epiroticus TaxID=199890 RepID=A0A182PE02_9DIPT
MAREILTFQLGNYSNYIGTHWWNIQVRLQKHIKISHVAQHQHVRPHYFQESSFNYEPNAEPSEIDHSVLYREGQTRQRQVTFTPRLLMLDLNGTLKHVPRTGDLYEQPIDPEQIPADDPTEVVADIGWETGKVEVIKKEKPAERHPYQKDLLEAGTSSNSGEDEEKDYNFSQTVQDWIDYSYTRYHPRSINVIERYTHSREESQLDTITNGMELWKDFDFQDDFTDRVRQYIEECDGCQGFQTLFDCGDGFSGVAVKLLEHLQDEYGKATLTFPVFAPKALAFKNADEPMSDSIRVINTALAFAQLPEQCSLFVPLSTMARCWRNVSEPRALPNLVYDPANFYQTSAILASFLETVTLRYRLKGSASAGSGAYISGMCGELSAYGRKMAAAGLALPFPLDAKQDLIDCLDQLENGQSLTVQLSPNVNVRKRAIIQSVCARGLPQNRLKRPPTAKSAQRQQIMPAYRCSNVSEMLQFFYSCTLEVSMSHVSSINSPIPIRQPFPVELFDKRIGFDGFLTDDPLAQAAMPYVQSCPSLAAIQSSADLGDGLDALHREVSRIRLGKIPRFAECGLEEVDYKEHIEQLLEFKENYDENYEL